MTVFSALRLWGRSYETIKRGQNDSVIAFIICIIFALWLGLRPPTHAFADTGNYARIFYIQKYNWGGGYVESSEWIWSKFTYICSQTVDVSIYFTIISIGYFGFMFFACKKLLGNNVLVAVLFMLGAFSFFTYAVNGIRNGLACSIALAAIAFCAYSHKNLLVGIALAFLAVNIHRTTLLPLASLFASIYLVKSFKWAYTFWILSILISLVAGGAVSAFFAGLGFDDRLSYITSSSDGQYTKTWFRWDFLIYSMMPIILGYYVVIKRGIQDRTYMILLNTYTLANAFWVMVIRASYSNRFAYLSWFMYPLVLAYPLLKLDIWGDKQGKYAARIMLAHVGFTWFMATIY